MKRSPRLLICIALTCSLNLTSLMGADGCANSGPQTDGRSGGCGRAPRLPPAAAAPDTAPATQPAIPENQTLRADVDDFLALREARPLRPGGCLRQADHGPIRAAA